MGLDAAIDGSIGTSGSDFMCVGLRWSCDGPSCRDMDGLVACAIPPAPL